MFPKVNPTTTQAWLLLKKHYQEEMQRTKMKTLFENDPDRFAKFSVRFNDILFDYSKNIITPKTLQLLQLLAEECNVKDSIEAMFNGEKINEPEGRAVLHTALRNFSGKPVMADSNDVMPGVKKVLEQMKSVWESIHSGNWKGYTGKPIKCIVNIGIGGRDLGP